ncbi:hypothetical protein [Ureibacillus sp. GCM10028918]|uniref:hypothetical protein n=1 Tax=Ureibacillus sp. GCM10028918 TaxID=3273429 RepID=UPI003605CDA0
MITVWMKSMLAEKEQELLRLKETKGSGWYAINPSEGFQVKYVRKDGIEEIVESTDAAMLKEWDK